jgi:aerobic-type carbon monoxide dehydrogenase small subunit (CoxS/CutS family)
VIVGGEAVRSCLMFAVQVQGKPIRTVEGLAKDGVLHPLQRAFIAHHGLQCGFCTPGFLMLTANVLEKNPNIGDDELLDVLSSNLCRCTGYQNIIKAVRAAAAEMRPPDAAVIEPEKSEIDPAQEEAPAAPPELMEQG